jgi:hypothetical protein
VRIDLHLRPKAVTSTTWTERFDNVLRD